MSENKRLMINYKVVQLDISGVVGLSVTELIQVIAEKKIKIGEHLAKLQARRWLFLALCAPGHHTAKSQRKCTTQSTFFPITMPNIR